MRRIPTREEINPVAEDLDGQMALKHFYGKSQSEAAKLFFGPELDAMNYIDDLRWMGSKAFSFYFPSVEPYLLSQESKEDSNAINVMIGVLEGRMEFDPLSIKECLADVLRILTYVSGNMAKFNADPEIYGDLAGELDCLIEKVRTMETEDN